MDIIESVIGLIDDGSQPTETVPQAGNDPPVGNFTLDNNGSTVPTTVTMRADGSYDPDGSITKYRYDIGGESKFGPVQTKRYTADDIPDGTPPNTVVPVDFVRLTVFDDDGALDQTPNKTINIRTQKANKPPTANFGIYGNNGRVPTTITLRDVGSSDPDGEIVAYRFDVGGNIRTGPVVPLTYTEADIPSGTPPDTLITVDKVSLEVEDNDGATDETRELSIQIRSPKAEKPPTAAVSVSPSSGVAPFTATFDASDSSDPDGTIQRYEWSFSDGERRSGARVTRRFTEADVGEITGSCTVTDNTGKTDTASDTIQVNRPKNKPPSAIATATPKSDTAPVNVTFDAGDSSDPNGKIESYSWTLPGGETMNGKRVKKTFNADDAGELTASVTVTDNEGASDTDTVTFTVKKPPNTVPTAEATAVPQSASPPATVTLSGDGSTDPDGEITGYSWTIPGIGTKEGQETTVQFTAGDIGTYDIKLTVRDNRGATATDTVTVNIVEQQLLPDISDETVAQGAIVGVGVLSSVVFDDE